MDEQQLRRQIDEVRTGARSRRAFLHEVMVLGLSAPFVTQMLAHGGVAMAATDFKYAPTKAGGGGLLKLLWWQSPTRSTRISRSAGRIRTVRVSSTSRSQGGTPDGNLVPVLAAEVPSVEYGTVDKELTWVVWKLKPGVKWHDGQLFTADDCVFNCNTRAIPRPRRRRSAPTRISRFRRSMITRSRSRSRSRRRSGRTLLSVRAA